MNEPERQVLSDISFSETVALNRGQNQYLVLSDCPVKLCGNEKVLATDRYITKERGHDVFAENDG